MAMARKHNGVSVTFEYDNDPDFSWLEQDHYNPRHPSYSPIYRTLADMRRKRNPIDGDWYRDPENHVVLVMVVRKRCNLGEEHVVDSLGNIDFLRGDGDRDWTIGTFTSLRQLRHLPRASYLRQLAREAGLR